MEWLIFSFLLLFAYLANALCSQQFKFNGRIMAFWQAGIPLIATLPIALYVDWPTHPLFYLGCLGAGTLSFATVVRRLEAPKLFGARVMSSLMPLTVVISFALWFSVSSTFRNDFLSNPTQVALISIVMLAVMYSVYRMRNRCNVSFSALIYLIPVIGISSVIAVLNKVAMDNSALISGVVVYVFLQSILLVVTRIITNKRQGIHMDAYFEKGILKLGLLIGFIAIAVGVFKGLAMAYAPNPAYVLLVCLLQPFFTDIANKMLNYRDKSDKVSGSIVVASVMILVVATKLL